MQSDFEIIGHTADIGVAAYGVTIDEAFANAARALFSLIVEPDTVSEKLYRDIELTAADDGGLLVSWLNELIFIFDTEFLIFSRFDVAVSGCGLRARAYGEKVDSSRHTLKTGVKAATYHMLSVECGKDACRVQVIFDI